MLRDSANKPIGRKYLKVLCTMAELCQKSTVVLEIDTEKNRDAEHKLPVGYWIENIVADILSELDHLFGMTAWAEPAPLAA